jgi:hypothetical protein
MPIVIPTKAVKKQYELPSEGVVLGVMADVIDLGVVKSKYGTQEKVRFKWLVDEKDSQGQLNSVVASYPKIMKEGSVLRKAVKQILGHDIEGDVETFDVETLIGRCNLLAISHVKKDRVYANVDAILKAPAGALLKIPGGFRRKVVKP